MYSREIFLAVTSTNVFRPGGRGLAVSVLGGQENASLWARVGYVIVVGADEQPFCIQVQNEARFETFCKLVSTRRCGLLLTEDSHCQPTATRMRYRCGGDSQKGFT